MKRLTWIAGMVLTIGITAMPMASVDGSTFASCLDKSCNRNNDCLVECDACDTPTPIIEGNCTI